MNPLLRRLAILRFKVRFLDGWQGICALITLVLLAGIAVGALDYAIHLPTLVRATVLVGMLVGAAGIVYRYLIRPFGKPCNDLNLALRVEEEFPELNDSLASTVQFLSQTKEDQERQGGSAAMRERTIQQAIDKAAQYDFARILNRKAGLVFGLTAFVAIGLAAWVGYANGASAQTAFWRLVEPFGMHTWTQVAVYRDGESEPLDPKSPEPDRIAVGRPYVIKVFLSGQIPRNARVEIKGKSQLRSDMNIDKLIPGANGQSASFVAPINMTQQYQNFEFRVVANDGSFPPRAGVWHEVKVMHKPKLIELDGKPSPQITIVPPAYTDLPPAPLLPGAKQIELLAGSRAAYRARADRELVEAYIRWQPVADSDEAAFMQAVGFLAGAVVPHKTYAQLDEKDKSIFSIPLQPWISGSYVLYMRDKYGLETEDPADIRVVKDPIPLVRLLKPAVSAEYTPDALVPFKFFVTDEKFAVKSVFVEFRRRALDGKNLDDEPIRIDLYDAQTNGKVIPLQIAQMLGLRAVPADLRLRQTKLSFDTTWSLKKHQFKAGEVVVIEVFAEDFCDIYGTREPGRSHTIELRIVSKRQIMQIAEQKLGEIQKDLERAAKQERKAIDTVQQTRKEEKFDQALKDKFTDGADAPQKDVRDIVGKDPTEGIRGELGKLRKMLADNGLDNTQPFREAGAIKGALENIAQEELNQLEPKLNDIRSDLNHNDKNSPATQKKLDEAAKLQQNVAKTLDGLIRKMDPGAEMRDIRNELRDIAGKEQQLRDDLAKMKAEKDQNLKDWPAKEFPKQAADLDKTFKDKVAQKSAEQTELADRLDKVLKEMKAEQMHQKELGNDKEAKKIEEAIKQLQQPDAEQPKQKQPEKQPESEKQQPLTAQMKDVAKELKDKRDVPEQALDKQQKIAQNLDKALDALEGRNPDTAKQDIKDRQDAEKKIEELAKDLRKVRQEEKQADQIKDMEERLKKKQEIADKLGKLQDRAEDLRRQLAQLQEQPAAKAMKDAADELEKAAQKAQQGGDAQKEEADAQKKIAEAKQEVKDSEDQLAREMLIKMADQLKGLKERQDASLKRTEDLHPKVMKRKSWTDALLDTLGTNIDAQKGIADETEDLAKKLEGAVVFGGILNRAKKSMDEAGTVMDGRKDVGFKERRYVEAGKGEQFNDMEVKDELESQQDTVKHQKQASRSLTNLLDALKEEIDKKKKPQVAKNDPDKDPPEKDERKGGVPNQDGIPPTAQLKALKAEQLDLNERTIDFDKRNPEPARFDDRQRAELRALEAEQVRLQELFGKLTAQKEGDQP